MPARTRQFSRPSAFLGKLEARLYELIFLLNLRPNPYAMLITFALINIPVIVFELISFNVSHLPILLTNKTQNIRLCRTLIDIMFIMRVFTFVSSIGTVTYTGKLP